MYYHTYRYTTHVISHVQIHYTCDIARIDTLHMYYHM